MSEPIILPGAHARVERGLDTLAEESTLFLIKVFRGAVRMDEPENRVMASVASSSIGAWGRYEATKSQRQQTELVRAGIFARDLGGNQVDYLSDKPEPRPIESGSE